MTRLVALLLVVAACNGFDAASPADDECDTLAPGASFSGRNGWTLSIVATNPSPPSMNTNWWAVTIHDPAHSPMIDPAALTVTARLPELGHGSPAVPTVTAETDGLIVGPIELDTAGQWEVRFDVEDERIVLAPCIDL